MYGHEGTVLDIVYITKVDRMVSCSTDRTMRIWVLDATRRHMAHPGFVLYQKIQDFMSISRSLDMEALVWVNCIEINDTERLGIYAGDSEGSLLKFKAPKEWRTKCEFDFDKKFKGIHGSKKFPLGIIQVLDVQKESMTFSIGYDHFVRGYNTLQYDQLTKDNYIFEMENPKKCLFTCMCWDEEKKLLYLADELGYVHVAYVYMGAGMTITK